MAVIGEKNLLKVARKVEFGVYLDGENLGDILLPRSYMPDNCKIGDELEVFIFFDSEDRIIASTKIPYAFVDEFAYLKVKSVTTYGAFLEWGLQKDLLVPYREQSRRMEEGKSYVVYIYLDKKSNRLAASSRLDKFIDEEEVDYEEGEQVNLLITYKTDLGYKAIVNNANWGVIYENEVFAPIKVGQRLTGYIKKVREDNKIDLSLQKPGIEKVIDVYETILQKLRESKGFLHITDKTEAELIYKLFGVSKKTYKKAVGALYKRRLITIEPNGIKLVEKSDESAKQ